MNDILEGLNKQQKEAVLTTEGPLEILAGAGSGKTTVMMRRTAYLVKEKGVFPNRILGVTFTNKAAKEMKDRIVKLIGEEGKFVHFYTFHSFCVREILRNDITELGYRKSFTIYDDMDSKKVVARCIKELNLDPKTFKDTVFASYISSLKSEMIDTKTYLTGKPSHPLMNWEKALYIMSKIPSGYRQVLADVYKLYQEKLKDSNAMDFDDILNLSVMILYKFPAIKEKYQNEFDYILVDEYQDTNRAQYQLIKMLAEKHQNLAVVGDDSQSIYGFRGADIQNILDFEKDYPNAKIIKLEQNYRSTQPILNVANEVINKNGNQKEKTLFTENKSDKLVEYHIYDTDRAEAYGIVRKIEREVIEEHKREYSDYTILVRINADTRLFEETFMTNNIPYEIVGGQKFYDRKEIKDMMAYLKFLINKDDKASFERLCGVPKRGIGDSAIDKIFNYARNNKITLWQAVGQAESILGGKALKGIVALRKLVNELDEMQKTDNVPTIVTILYNRSGLLDDFSADDDKNESHRCENVEQFINSAWQFVEDTPKGTLGEFVEKVALTSDIDNLSEGDKVKVMTYHASKGLEFPVVFLVCFEEDSIPYGKAKTERGGLQEETRLAYVGITRAKNELIISNCRLRRRFGQAMNPKPSQFLKYISPENLTGDYVGNESECPW